MSSGLEYLLKNVSPSLMAHYWVEKAYFDSFEGIKY